MSKIKQKTLPNEVRILGGRWRGRKLTVADNAMLRPTPSRVRTTLFNWLMFDIKGAHCLDLFAGTGALGFEALSRGAQKTVFVESDKSTTHLLNESAQKFGAEEYTVITQTAEQYIQQSQMGFDVIFLDPPFQENKLLPLLNSLKSSRCLQENTFIYIEAPAFPEWPAGFTLHKASQAGQVHFGLLKYQAES